MDVAPLIGRLPLGGERAIVELKARWLLGDVDVDRCPVNAAAIVSASAPANIDPPSLGDECCTFGTGPCKSKIRRPSG